MFSEKSVFNNSCTDKDIAVKSFFLGPLGENFDWFKEVVDELLSLWEGERQLVNRDSGRAVSGEDLENRGFQEAQIKLAQEAKLLRSRLQSEVPFYSSKFMSHMVYESSLAGLLGHMITLLHNPNLISSEVSKKTSFIESEAISALVKMIGYSAKGNGHFTSGGTIANIEALWRARFRLDHWLALGAAIDEQQPHDGNCWMNWAHMGWQEYYRYQAQVKGGLKVIESKSFVLQNPFQLSTEFYKQYGKSYLGPVLLVPGNKHYSWQKGLSLLGYGMEAFWQIDLDQHGRLDIVDLEVKIEKARKEFRPILMVVSVAGTTEMGEVDPVDKIQNLLDQYKEREGIDIWHHVDAAYGGFYCSLLRGDNGSGQILTEETVGALEAISRSDSVTIDPHKLGYVPYACGAILVPDEHNYETSSFHAPYIGESREKWMKTIEGSRAATGAGATWLSAKAIGFNSSGMGKILEKGILARLRIQDYMQTYLPEARFFEDNDTNVFCFCLAKESEALSVVNERSQRIFTAHSGQDGYYVSKTTLDSSSYGRYVSRLVELWNGHKDEDQLVFVRLVFMNPYLISSVQREDIEKEFVHRLKDFLDE